MDESKFFDDEVTHVTHDEVTLFDLINEVFANLLILFGATVDAL